MQASELGWPTRIDAEYYRSDFLSLIKKQSANSLEQKTLKDLCTKIDVGFVGPMSHAYAEDGIPLLQTQNVKEFLVDYSSIIYINKEFHKQLSKSQLFPGDVLIARSGSIGNAAIVTSKDLQPLNSSDIVILHPNENLNGYYLCAYINSKFGQAQIERLSSGGVQGHINLGALEKVVIPLLPNKFQSRIEHIITTAQAKRNESKQLYADAENILASELGLNKLDLSESLFSVKYVSQVSESHRADAEYYKRKYYNLLGHIEKRPHSTLQEIASFSGGATPLGADYLEEGIPFLRIQNVGDNRLVLDDVVYIDENVHNNLLKRSQIRPDDVLLTITGRIGTSAVVSDDMKTGNINQHIVRMRLNSKELNPYYLAAFMNSVGGRLQTERESYGTTRDALPYYCLAKIQVLHADMGLQKEIEATIRMAEEIHKEAKHLLAEAKSQVERLIEG